MNLLKSKWTKVGALVLASLTIVGALWWYINSSKNPIQDFDDKRDTQEILKIFERDRYWLLSSEDYSPEFMMKYRAPNQELQYLGRLKINVWWHNNKFVGFTAYYMKTPELGWLLFLAVNPEFRGKQKAYAQKLLQYGLDQLALMGAQKIRLVTRVDNSRAQGLYKRVGFYEISRDDGFVYFEYDPLAHK